MGTGLIVRDLAERGELHPDALEGLLAGRPMPLVEPGGVTFVYRGPAESVQLHHWGYGLPPGLAFTRVDGSDLWWLALDMPQDARFEYKLHVRDHGTMRLVEDPLNPQRAHNPFGANSVCATWGYEVPDWACHDAAAPPGTLRDVGFRSQALGRPVELTVYLPAMFHPAGGRRFPLLVVHDGGDYLHYAGMATVLDNVIHRRIVPELVSVFIRPGERLAEYADDERHARFLTEELVPRLELDLPLTGAASGRCLMGASFGAVASLAAASRAPGFYGRLLLQSGSFASTHDHCAPRQGPIWQPVMDFVDRFRSSPWALTERIYACCGIYESLICENRSFVPVLESTGMEVWFRERRDGHNWECWRDCLGEALPYLFSDVAAVATVG